MTMLKATFLLSCAALVVAVPSVLREAHKPGNRISDGEYAREGDFPWQVSIQTNSGIHKCGGSIISNEYILTSATCSMNDTTSFRVVAGILRLDDAQGSVHSVVEINSHSYNPITRTNDISVWKINPPFTFGDNTQAVSLPAQGTESEVDKWMLVSGWGNSYIGGPMKVDLQEVTAPIVDKTECNDLYVSYGGIHPGNICAGFLSGGQSTCEGDTGGALVLDGEQRGIVSWHVGCGLTGFPGVYTEVSAFRDWITQVSGV